MMTVRATQIKIIWVRRCRQGALTRIIGVKRCRLGGPDDDYYYGERVFNRGSLQGLTSLF